MRRGRYAQAARLVRPWAASDAQARFTHTLSRNLLALHRHRPEIVEALGDPTDLGPYRLVVGPAGHPTIAMSEGGTTRALSPGGDPIANLRHLAPQLNLDDAAPPTIALAGVGDGYVLQFLAQQPELQLGMERCVYVIEPDPRVLAACLHLLDHTDARGPIAQPRFHWCVGPGWVERYTRLLDDDAMQPPAGRWVQAPPHGPNIDAALRRVVQHHQRQSDAAVERLQRLTAGDRYAAHRLADRLAGKAGPPPRALLLTSRFTTVLQYSTRDVAQGFRDLGWETQTVIEPTPWSRMTARALGEAVAGFDPDLVFQIDHLRHELPPWFPRDVPFLCWIQDHLPNLDSDAAGRCVGHRDYVLAPGPHFYVRRFGYPASQCIATPRLASAIDTARLEDVAFGERPVIVYAGHASGRVETLRRELVENQEDAQARALLDRASAALVRAYEQERCVHTYRGYGRLIDQAARELGGAVKPEIRMRLIYLLAHPLNNTLYRQQAIRWARAAAEAHGLELELYGHGWADHPEFAPHARGYADYQTELPAITRSAAINLQIVPFTSFTHQRWIDGIAAAGFFLLRDHPADREPAALLSWLSDQGVDDAGNSDEVRRRLPSDQRDAFERRLETVRDAVSDDDTQDPVEMIGSWRDAGLLEPGRPPLPHMDEVAFADEAELVAQVGRFLAEADTRRRFVEAQHDLVAQRMTYTGGMRRVLAKVRRKLLDETASAEGSGEVRRCA